MLRTLRNHTIESEGAVEGTKEKDGGDYENEKLINVIICQLFTLLPKKQITVLFSLYESEIKKILFNTNDDVVFGIYRLRNVYLTYHYAQRL